MTGLPWQISDMDTITSSTESTALGALYERGGLRVALCATCVPLAGAPQDGVELLSNESATPAVVVCGWCWSFIPCPLSPEGERAVLQLVKGEPRSWNAEVLKQLYRYLFVDAKA